VTRSAIVVFLQGVYARVFTRLFTRAFTQVFTQVGGWARERDAGAWGTM